MFMGPVAIWSYFLSARLISLQWRSRGLSKRGRRSYAKDKPPVFTR